MIDSKRGKVWINDPRSDKVKLTASIEKDIDHYFKWIEVIAQIRNSTPEQVEKIVQVVKNEMEKAKKKWYIMQYINIFELFVFLIAWGSLIYFIYTLVN